MTHDDRFGRQLNFALKLLVVSNGRFAADLGVDKSLVGRWSAGSVRPSAHNLARLTDVLAQRMPGFTLLDWELPQPAFEALMTRRLAMAPPVPSAITDWLAMDSAVGVAAATASAGAGVTGIWRSTRPAPDVPGRFAHDYSIIVQHPDGSLGYRAGVFSARLQGWAMIVADQLFCCASTAGMGSLSFVILNRVRKPRVDAMDGVSIACSPAAGGIPMAISYYNERIAELSGDADADTARWEELLTGHPLAPEGSVPAALRDHLLRDVGPTAFAGGGDLVLMMRSMASLARGTDGATPFVVA